MRNRSRHRSYVSDKQDQNYPKKIREIRKMKTKRWYDVQKLADHRICEKITARINEKIKSR